MNKNEKMHLQLKQKSDKELWKLLQKSNKVAFSLLYKRHVHSLYGFGLKLSSDKEIIKDTLQELFIDFWNKRASLSTVEHVKVYLIKSFRYKLLRSISKSNKSRNFSFEELFMDIPELELIETETSLERKRLLKEKLNQLPNRQREIIHLRYFHNLKNDEIAEVLEMNYQSVANLLSRSIKNLKKKLAFEKP